MLEQCAGRFGRIQSEAGKPTRNLEVAKEGDMIASQELGGDLFFQPMSSTISLILRLPAKTGLAN